MAKVLLVIGDAAEVLDTFYPLFRVREDGHDVVVAGPAKRTYDLVLHERPEGWDMTRETPGYRLAADVAFKDVRPDEYLGMVIRADGRPEYLRYDADLLRVVRSFFYRDLPVASICHGIEIVAAAGVLRGRTVTTVQKCQFDAEGGGATYVDRDGGGVGKPGDGADLARQRGVDGESMRLLNKVAPPLARRPEKKVRRLLSGRFALRAGLGEGGDEVEDGAELGQAHAVAVEELLHARIRCPARRPRRALGEVGDHWP